VEHLWKASRRGNFRQAQGRQVTGRGLYVTRVHVFGFQKTGEEFAETVVAQTGDDADFGAQPRQSDRHVGARAAEIARESPNLRQRKVRLLGIEIVANPAQYRDVHAVTLANQRHSRIFRVPRAAHPGVIRIVTGGHRPRRAGKHVQVVAVVTVRRYHRMIAIRDQQYFVVADGDGFVAAAIPRVDAL